MAGVCEGRDGGTKGSGSLHRAVETKITAFTSMYPRPQNADAWYDMAKPSPHLRQVTLNPNLGQSGHDVFCCAFFGLPCYFVRM